MARAAPTGWSTSNHLIRSGFVKDGEALLMHAWGNFPSHADMCVMSQGQAATLNHRRSLIKRGAADRYRATSQSTGASSADSPTGATTNTWEPTAGVFMTSTSRFCALELVRGTEQTGPVTPGTPNEILIGILHDDSMPWSSTGAIGEPSMWDLTGLTTTDVDALLAELGTLVEGLARNPLLINQDTGAAWEGLLLAYWDLDVNSPTFGEDLTGNGHDLTEVGTLTAFASYPPVAAAVSTCAVTGTMVQPDYVLESEIVTGGFTIILTLANDTWDADVGDDNAITTALIAGIVAALSPTGGWNDEVIGTLAHGNVVRTSDTVVTITLPAVAGYNISVQEEITVTIPTSALTVSAAPIVAEPSLTIHPVIATARRSAKTWVTATNYLKTNSVFLPARTGYFFSAWKQRDANKGTVMGIGVEGQIEHLEKLFNEVEDMEAWVGTVDGIDKPQAIVNGIINNRWYHVACSSVATNSRWIWARGALEGEKTSDLSGLIAADVIMLGARPDFGEPGSLTFAEPSWWDSSAMTLNEIRALKTRLATLINGIAPTAKAVNADVGEAWTGKLLADIDLDFNGPTFGQDRSGNGHHFTKIGTGHTQFSSYAPVGHAWVLTADAGSFSVSGADATFTTGHHLAADAGSYVITGADATLTYFQPESYELVADPGAFILTGSDATLRVSYVIVAAAGSFAISGTEAAFTQAVTLVALAGSFAITGTAATLIHSGPEPPAGVEVVATYTTAVEVMATARST